MKKPWTLIIIVIIVIGFGVCVGLAIEQWKSEYGAADASVYAAVYLSSGDVYYGQIAWRPTPHLTDVWYLEKAAAPNGTVQYGIAPFKNAVWGPIDEIFLNQSNILYWTYLRTDSPVAKIIANPSLYQQLQNQLNQPQTSIPVAGTSTPGGTSGTNAK
jgi:hypothetical protein